MTMEMEQENIEKASFFTRGWLLIKGILSNLVAKLYEFCRQMKKIAKDDPRKWIHSLKVGITLALVSLFYYIEPLYNNYGVSTMWAVMTVVVVFEFSVGATIGKGLNRGFATLVAGALGLGAHHLASATGKTCEPILIEIFVFLQAVISTFIRFFPQIKARYDYGVLIFILTFSLVSISGFRSDEILKLAKDRLLTILIGASTCVIVSILVCPVWAGEDLHMLIARHLDNLGNCLEGFADEYFRILEMGETKSQRSSSINLKSILDSKSSEETLANFARWEPGHGKFMYRHPWKQYLKIGSLTRQCAGRVDALNSYLNSKTPQETGGKIQEAFFDMSLESGKALKELSLAIQKMAKPSSPNPHMDNLKVASNNLKSILKSHLADEYADFCQVIPVATVASLLFDTIISVENIVDAVNELSSLAKFRCNDLSSGVHEKSAKGSEKKVHQAPHVCITIE